MLDADHSTTLHQNFQLFRHILPHSQGHHFIGLFCWYGCVRSRPITPTPIWEKTNSLKALVNMQQIINDRPLVLGSNGCYTLTSPVLVPRLYFSSSLIKSIYLNNSLVEGEAGYGESWGFFWYIYKGQCMFGGCPPMPFQLWSQDIYTIIGRQSMYIVIVVVTITTYN